MRPRFVDEAPVITGADSVRAVSCSDALRQRGRPIKLFTAALLITHGGFDRDPVVEFDARVPADSSDLRPFSIQLVKDSEAFFVGLGATLLPGRKTTVNWDKRLYGIDQDRAEACFSFLGGIAFSNPKTGLFAHTFSHEVVVRDPTSLQGETLTVTVFGITTNFAVCFISDNVLGPARVQCVPLASKTMPPAVRDFITASGFTGDNPIDMRN